MKETYIFEAVRTPRRKGSSKSGALKDIKPIHLLSQLFQSLEKRTNLVDKEKEKEAIILGCVEQVRDQAADIAKIAAVYHGWDARIDGVTANTFCSSALTANGIAAAKIRSGMSDLVIVGGVEMLSRVPMFSDKGA